MSTPGEKMSMRRVWTWWTPNKKKGHHPQLRRKSRLCQLTYPLLFVTCKVYGSFIGHLLPLFSSYLSFAEVSKLFAGPQNSLAGRRLPTPAIESIENCGNGFSKSNFLLKDEPFLSKTLSKLELSMLN